MLNVGGRVAAVPVYVAVGIGPLVAGRTVIDGFIGVQEELWLARTSLAIEWLAFTVFGYFFGRTLARLALDYEVFWRVPGRISAFARLLADEVPHGALDAHVQVCGGELPVAMASRSLRNAGITSKGLDRLYAIYAIVRAGWLAALVCLVSLVVEILRRAVGGDAGITLLAVAAAAAVVVQVIASWGTVIVGRRVAWTVADLLCRCTPDG